GLGLTLRIGRRRGRFSRRRWRLEAPALVLEPPELARIGDAVVRASEHEALLRLQPDDVLRLFTKLSARGAKLRSERGIAQFGKGRLLLRRHLHNLVTLAHPDDRLGHGILLSLGRR